MSTQPQPARHGLAAGASILALLATIAVNFLANAIPLNGQTTGEISDRYGSLFTPAGYVFAIWGLIYLGLAVFAVFQALAPQRANPRVSQARWAFVLSCIANAIWVVLWHYELLVGTVVAMLALAGTLLVIYLRAGIGVAAVPTREQLAFHAVFSLYLGWVTVATIANVSVALIAGGWERWGLAPETWTVIWIGVTAVLGIVMSLTRGDFVFMAVFAWALAGIGVEQAGVAVVARAAWIAAGVVVLALALALFRNRWLYRTRPATG